MDEEKIPSFSNSALHSKFYYYYVVHKYVLLYRFGMNGQLQFKVF